MKQSTIQDKTIALLIMLTTVSALSFSSETSFAQSYKNRNETVLKIENRIHRSHKHDLEKQNAEQQDAEQQAESTDIQDTGMNGILSWAETMGLSDEQLSQLQSFLSVISVLFSFDEAK